MLNNFNRKFASAWLGNDALNHGFTGAAIGDPTYGWDDHSNKTSEVIYPDSTSGTDRVKHRYNRQGEVIETTDQNQTERAFDYDLLGWQIQDRVVTLGSGVDGSVRRIETAFNKQGGVERITSFDSETAGSGNVVNEVFVLYNGFRHGNRSRRSSRTRVRSTFPRRRAFRWPTPTAARIRSGRSGSPIPTGAR